jgi:DNA topoisomerase-3
MSILIITEKPSVARQIASALGKPKKEGNHLVVGDYVIAHALGHLLQFAYPEEYGERFKKWRLEDLPIIPKADEWQLVPIGKTALKQLQEIKSLWEKADMVISATDAGREGELIFRFIQQYVGIEKPVKRLWLQSLTKETIREQIKQLLDLSELDDLYASALARSKADWLVGINASRAFTVVSKKEVFSVGRVQTPTLAILVDREKEIQNFIPRTYYKVKVRFEVDGNSYWAESVKEYDEEEANKLAEELVGKTLSVAEQSQEQLKFYPPLLPDLGDLQKFTSRTFRWSADKTLKVLQRLYENALVTYPRTDSRYLPTDMKKQVIGTADKLQPLVPDGEWDYVKKLNNRGRIFNNAKITDHFAIIPTGKTKELKGDDEQLFDYVVKRFLAAFYPPALETHQKTVLSYGEHQFEYNAVRVDDPSWYVILGMKESQPLLPEIDNVIALETGADKRQTKPPPRFTDGMLIAAMETAGKMVESEELAEALKEKGIGTPATRAEIIERLIEMGYVQRNGPQLIPTSKGIMLIDSLREVKLESLTEPELTGEWERRLGLIEKGKESAESFMWSIEQYVEDIVKTLSKEESSQTLKSKQNMPIAKCPFCDGYILEAQKSYYCSNWKNGCKFRVWKNMNGGVITADDVRRLVSEGRTRLKRFRSKAGKSYRAFLVLKDGQVAIEFPTRKK